MTIALFITNFYADEDFNIERVGPIQPPIAHKLIKKYLNPKSGEIT